MIIRWAAGCALSVSCLAAFACASSSHSVEAPSSGSADPSESPIAAAASAGSSRPAKQDSAVPDPPSASPSRGAPLDDSAFPTACERAGDLCLPPRAFVRHLCQSGSTGTAFHLFEKDTPFSRGYVRSREVRAVNTLGGPASDANLTFGEEVLILTRTGEAKPGGMEVSGMGGYDVLRWDGTCATLADGEIALRPPVPPRHAPLDWQYIEPGIQEVLLRDASVRGARKEQRQQCHGVSLGTRSRQCIDADARLGDSIVLAVRSGLELPPPEPLP